MSRHRAGRCNWRLWRRARWSARRLFAPLKRSPRCRPQRLGEMRADPFDSPKRIVSKGNRVSKIGVTDGMRALIFLIAAMAAACSPNPVYRQSDEPLPVAYIDQARYLGLWHEQARLPNSFEEGCQRATAEYALRDDGLISVVNTCY